MRFRFAEEACSAFWRRVRAAVAVPPASLGVFRWVFGLYCLAFEAPYYTFIDLAPRAFFDPPLFSLAALVSGFPPAPLFRVVDFGALLALCAVTVGFYTRSASTALVLLRLFGAHFHYSFGKIDHDILLLAIPACMVLGDWGRHYSVDAWRRRTSGRSNASDQNDASAGYERGPMLFAVLLGFGMFSAGLGKAFSWIDFDLGTSGVLSWFYPNRLTFEREFLLAPHVGSVPGWLFELADYTAPLLEVGAMVALLISRRAWLAWLLAATVFHVLNVLVLNINFVGYAVLYTCFADLSRLGELLKRWGVLLIGVAAAMTGFHLLTRVLWNGAAVVFAPGPTEAYVAGLYAALPIGVVVALGFGRELAACWRNQSAFLNRGSA